MLCFGSRSICLNIWTRLCLMSRTIKCLIDVQTFIRTVSCFNQLTERSANSDFDGALCCRYWLEQKHNSANECFHLIISRTFYLAQKRIFETLIFSWQLRTFCEIAHKKLTKMNRWSDTDLCLKVRKTVHFIGRLVSCAKITDCYGTTNCQTSSSLNQHE